VQPSGSQQVTPAESTTYHLTAKGAGGTQEATARVTVTQSAPPTATAPSPTEEDLFASSIKDVYFDYDKSDIRGDQQSSIQADAQFLSQHSNVNFTVEVTATNADPQSTTSLWATQRAVSVKTALTQAGVPVSRIKRSATARRNPFCTESNEACWQQNRRGHFVYQK